MPRVTRTLIVSVALVCAAATVAQAQPAPTAAFGFLGIHFERNGGQASSDAEFVAHGAGYDLVLTRAGGW